jgi:predicted nuclease of predicted toxin-antitoxin system
MRILFDENAPDKLVQGIACFTHFFDDIDDYQITSVSLLKKLSATDEEVLKLVGKGGILITYDKDFKKHKNLKTAIAKHEIGIFWVQQPKRPDFFELGKFLLNNWEDIIEKIKTENRPFIYQVLKKGISRVHL